MRRDGETLGGPLPPFKLPPGSKGSIGIIAYFTRRSPNGTLGSADFTFFCEQTPIRRGGGQAVTALVRVLARVLQAGVCGSESTAWVVMHG